MEILIDFERVRRLMREEYAQARREIQSLGPIAAYARSQERLDERLANAPDAPTLACKAGCSWCCHFTIDLRPVEVFRILDFMNRHLDQPSRERVHVELLANRRITSLLDDTARMQMNIKCPFLVEGRCSIYVARPQTCRNYHATDAAGCQKSFEEPENLSIDPEFAPLVYQIGGSHVEAFSKAMRDEGYDVDAYEMNVVLSTALEHPEAAALFERKRKPFAELEGDEVPAEFEEESE
jgi:Fe-S-cluster containining protein